MLLINGNNVETISALDRGVQFGDGCFTTATISHGKIIFFDEHLSRLRYTCERLNINFSHWEQLEIEMKLLANIQQQAVLKVIITRGISFRGYDFKNCKHPTRIVYAHPKFDNYKSKKVQGIILTLSPIRLGRNSYLAGLKHLNRLEQILIYSYLRQTQADETVVLDSDGWVTECCTANIFWRKGDTIYTPCLKHAGVAGIMRQFCLQQLKSMSFKIIKVYACEQELTKADEIIICNTLMPILPVKKYCKFEFTSRELFNLLSSIYEKHRFMT